MALIGTLVAVSFANVAVSSAAVDPYCVNNEALGDQHCYAQSEWNMAAYNSGGTWVPTPSVLVEGAVNFIWASSSSFNVPGFAKDRGNEPLWVAFTTGIPPNEQYPSLIESGQYAGDDPLNNIWPTPPTPDCCTLHFYIDAYLNNGLYQEADFPDPGPALNAYTEYETVDANRDGTWCQDIAGSQVTCWTGFPTYANDLQDGLELHGSSMSQVPSAGTGLSVAWAQFLDNNWYNQWQSNVTPQSQAINYRRLPHAP